MFLPKLIYTIKKYCRRFGSKQEKAVAADKDIIQFIRPKRRLKNLPDSWTDTRAIPRIKSWKNRSKKPHQYSKHILSDYELDQFFQKEKKKEEFLFSLSVLKKKDGIGWFYCSDTSDFIYGSYYTKITNDMLLELASAGLIIIESISIIHIFDNFGHSEKNVQEIVVRCRLP